MEIQWFNSCYPFFPSLQIRWLRNTTKHTSLGLMLSQISGLPIIKPVVGLAKAPDLSSVKSKIGSLDNVKHKPGNEIHFPAVIIFDFVSPLVHVSHDATFWVENNVWSHVKREGLMFSWRSNHANELLLFFAPSSYLLPVLTFTDRDTNYTTWRLLNTRYACGNNNLQKTTSWCSRR